MSLKIPSSAKIGTENQHPLDAFLLYGGINMNSEELPAFDFQPLTVHLHWQGYLDMDIMAVFEYQNGQRGMICFGEYGSQEQFPFMELLGDFQFVEVPVDNQEIIAIKAPANIQDWKGLSKIWILGWDFEALAEGALTDFAKHEVFLEIRQGEHRFTTDFTHLCKGNLIQFGHFIVGDALSFQLEEQVKVVELPEEMTEVQNWRF